MNKIRKGDQVIVLTGKDKKKRGVVLARVDAEHVIVEGVNVVKKAVKPNPATNQVGGLIDKTMPIHVSNVALLNPETGKGERVAIKNVDGKNVRVFRTSGKAVDAKA